MERRAPRVVAVLASLLERAAERGDGDGAPAATSVFRGRTRPPIAVRRYAERIYRYAGCSPACFVVAYAYLGRLANARPLVDDDGEEEEDAAAAGAEVVVPVDSYTVHRLLITAVMVAAKYMDDIHYNNAYFARVGGVEVAEMNGLELELLFALRFRLNLTPAAFSRYCAALEWELAAAEGPSPPPRSTTSEEAAEEDTAAAQVAGKSSAFAAAPGAALTVEIAQ